tara:strand:- start:862 stop:1068 length:207 start_codon:yes stop_codon:yes gene_type:complete
MSNIKVSVGRLKEIISEETEKFNQQKHVRRQEFLSELRELDSEEAIEYLQEIASKLSDGQIDLLLEGE